VYRAVLEFVFTTDTHRHKRKGKNEKDYEMQKEMNKFQVSVKYKVKTEYEHNDTYGIKEIRLYHTQVDSVSDEFQVAPAIYRPLQGIDCPIYNMAFP